MKKIITKKKKNSLVKDLLKYLLPRNIPFFPCVDSFCKKNCNLSIYNGGKFHDDAVIDRRGRLLRSTGQNVIGIVHSRGMHSRASVESAVHLNQSAAERAQNGRGDAVGRNGDR